MSTGHRIELADVANIYIHRVKLLKPRAGPIAILCLIVTGRANKAEIGSQQRFKAKTEKKSF